MLTSDILDIGTSRWVEENLRGYDLMFSRNSGFGLGGSAGATAALPSSFALPPVPNVSLSYILLYQLHYYAAPFLPWISYAGYVTSVLYLSTP
jgi:hypothetical protein